MNETRVVLRTMIALAPAPLGLAAALAWDEEIRAAIKQLLGGDESLAALLTYAVLATVLAVVMPLSLIRAAVRVGGEAAINREAEG